MTKLIDILKQLLLEEQKKADRCLRIARRRYKKSSAYRSGAIERCRQGDIWKDIKESNGYSQTNAIIDIFESNSKLTSIGSLEQYIKYLSTIFPNSKVKDIVYHGAIEQLLPKDGKFKGYITYFTDSKNYAETVGFPVNRKIISAIINIKNPFYAYSKLADVPEEVHLTDEYTNPRIIKSNTNGYDSVIGVDAGQKEGKTIAVFEPEQIHILGSKQDIEGFKRFTNTLTEAQKETLRTWFKRKDNIWKGLKENESKNPNLYISNSPIHGKGLFSKVNVQPNEFFAIIGDSILLPNENAINKWGDYINHSNNPNAKVKITDENIILYSIKPISSQDEILVDYTTLPNIFDRNIEGFTNNINEKQKETLRTWFKRKGTPGKEGGWVDCNTCRDGKCKACGRKKGEKRAKYPSCRPTPAQCKSPGKGKKWGKTK